MTKPQCFCLTNSGTRCKRYCANGTLKCFQHLKMATSNVRMLPSIDFTTETQRPEPKTNIVIDLTVGERSPPRMRTRLQTQRVLQAQLQTLNSIVEQTREPRNARLARQTMQVDPEQSRVKPRPPNRPIKRSQDKVQDKVQEQTTKSHKKASCCEDCCICYDQKVEEDRFLECGHALCETCIKSLRSDKCPMCRKEIESKYISKTEKKRMQRRKRDDDEERNEEAYVNYMRSIIQESGGNPSLFVDFF
jgi:hypothetical protein